MERVYSSEELERFVLAVHDGTSEVWLRTAIAREDDGEGGVRWAADEKYLELDFEATREWVDENFDALMLVQKVDAEVLVEVVSALGEEVAEQSAAICEIYEMLIGEE